MDEVIRNEVEELVSVSALPDFAQIYSFLQYFGRLLLLPKVTLNELENFFERGYGHPEEDPVAFIHWRLLSKVGKNEGRREWPKMAARFGRRCGVVREALSYSELSIKQKVKIFRLACEEQFDSNLGFKHELKKQLLPTDLQGKPLGVDRDGQRHWVLKDSTFDVRLYGERHYDEAPPQPADWVQLASSLDKLGVYVSMLEARGTERKKLVVENQPKSIEPHRVSQAAKDIVMETGHTNCDPNGAKPSEVPVLAEMGSSVLPAGSAGSGEPQATKKMRRKSQKKKERKVEVEAEVVGCLKCRRDTNHKQMLLCDGCDRECHMHCQYPPLWRIPDGKWICPLCKEKLLLSKLKTLYSELSEARGQYEKTVERKQRNVARLQRSGVLLQNIILEDEEEDVGIRRSKRARKEVNYAELNDIYLPPLGPRDYVGGGPPGVLVDNDYAIPYTTRSSRRLRGVGLEEDDTEEDQVLRAPGRVAVAVAVECGGEIGESDDSSDAASNHQGDDLYPGWSASNNGDLSPSVDSPLDSTGSNQDLLVSLSRSHSGERDDLLPSTEQILRVATLPSLLPTTNDCASK